MTAATVAVVLAGGEGRRMGGSKPLRRLGHTTLVEHAVALARGWCDTVAVAVRHADQVGAVDAALLLDDRAIPGPAAGLASALEFGERQFARRVLTLPCDMPRLPRDLLSRLEAGLAGGAAVAVAASGGRLHPVCALWHVRARPRLSPYIAAGRSSLKGFAEACGMAVVDWPAGEHDPFANANTPEDLAALQPEFGF